MHILILGANSDIAMAVAKKFAEKEHADFYLASRGQETLFKKARDLAIRYQVHAVPLYFDATDYGSHAEFYAGLDPKPDGAILAFGYLGNQQLAQTDFREASKIIETNYLGAVSILEIVAADFQKRGRGFIAAISSVAGERGRRKNYVYGSAKGALTVYLSGLRNRMFASGVKVITILPGFVKTKMTGGMDMAGILAAEPADVARVVHNAFIRGSEIGYADWYWKYIMTIIKGIPESLFKRLDL